MPTVSIGAELEDIAPVVLMPGDPLRAKFLAEKFLHSVKQVNDVRGMLAFTGYTDTHKRITIMGSGMGMPSMGIYSYELFKFYNVQLIIRIGTCGAFTEDLKIKDLIIASTASTDSNFASQYGLDGVFSAGADFYATSIAFAESKKKGLNVKVGNILSSDVFYDDDPNRWKKWAKLGVLGVEMESYALYCNAARLGRKALCIATVTDHFVTGEKLPVNERECLEDMAIVAIQTAEKFLK